MRGRARGETDIGRRRGHRDRGERGDTCTGREGEGGEGRGCGKERGSEGK